MMLHKRLWLGSLCLTAVFVSGQVLAFLWYPFELFTHFALYFALFWLFSAICLKRPERFVLLALAAGIILYAALPLSAWQYTTGSPGSSLRILAYNVHLDNPETAAETGFIRQTRADILILAEAANPWKTQIDQLRQDYLHGCEYADNSPFALYLLAQHPLAHCASGEIDGFPYLRAQTTDGRAIYALHPPPPVNAELAAARIRYLSGTAEKIHKETLPVLAAGDLNNTPYSPLYRQFTAAAQLSDEMPHGTPTWKPFYLPIDRVLSRIPQTQKIQVQTLPWQYSDHRGLLIEWGKTQS